MTFYVRQHRKGLEDAINMHFILHPEQDLCTAATEISALSGHIIAVCFIVGEKRGWTEELRKKMQGNMKFYGFSRVQE